MLQYQILVYYLMCLCFGYKSCFTTPTTNRLFIVFISHVWYTSQERKLLLILHVTYKPSLTTTTAGLSFIMLMKCLPTVTAGHSFFMLQRNHSLPTVIAGHSFFMLERNHSIPTATADHSDTDMHLCTTKNIYICIHKF